MHLYKFAVHSFKQSTLYRMIVMVRSFCNAHSRLRNKLKLLLGHLAKNRKFEICIKLYFPGISFTRAFCVKSEIFSLFTHQATLMLCKWWHLNTVSMQNKIFSMQWENDGLYQKWNHHICLYQKHGIEEISIHSNEFLWKKHCR